MTPYEIIEKTAENIEKGVRESETLATLAKHLPDTSL